jgi:hypothetical protein
MRAEPASAAINSFTVTTPKTNDASPHKMISKIIITSVPFFFTANESDGSGECSIKARQPQCGALPKGNKNVF